MQKVIDGLLIKYEILGRGKQNLVMMHGWGGNLEEWLETARIFSNRYRILLFDFPGLGQSQQPASDWDIYEYGKFTASIIEKLKFSPAVIMGHSFGGRVAILLASRYQNLVNKLILVDAAGMEMKSLKAKIFGSAFLAPFRMAKFLVPDRVRSMFRSKGYQRAGSMRKIFAKVVAQSLKEELSKITVQTLVIWGKQDKVLTLEEGKKLASRILRAKLNIIDGSSHWPYREQPAEFIRILKEEGF